MKDGRDIESKRSKEKERTKEGKGEIKKGVRAKEGKGEIKKGERTKERERLFAEAR